MEQKDREGWNKRVKMSTMFSWCPVSLVALVGTAVRCPAWQVAIKGRPWGEGFFLGSFIKNVSLELCLLFLVGCFVVAGKWIVVELEVMDLCFDVIFLDFAFEECFLYVLVCFRWLQLWTCTENCPVLIHLKTWGLLY